jgi:hypothetical protein
MNSMKNVLRKSILGLTVVLFLGNCQRENKIWESDYTLPLLKASLTFDDVTGDSLLVEKSDSSYDLVYDYIMEIDSFGDYLDVPDTLNRVNVSLQQLVLDDRELADTFTLREMAPETAFLDGLTVPLEAYDITDAGGEQEIDVSEAFFQTATFRKGFLDLELYNDLPVNVELIVFKLANKADGSVIIRDTFKDIPPFGSAMKTIDLSGKTVDGVLLGQVVRVKTSASSTPVLVDADKGIRIKMMVRDLEPENATAIFPEQNLVTDTQEVTYNLGGAKVTEMRLKSGFVTMKVYSTIQEAIVLTYRIPNSAENGDFNRPLERIFNVPPAKPGETQFIEKKFPLDGFVVKYKGKNSQEPPFFNTVYSEVLARTVYSGEVRTISLSDSVYVEFGLIEVVPDYAIGDFGNSKHHLKEDLKIKAFDNVSGAIDVTDVSMTLAIINSFGIQANVHINELVAQNTRDNTQVILSHPTFIGNTILVNRAVNPPLTASRRTFVFDDQNSNLESFLENLPNRIYADIELESRPNGSNDYTDFAFLKSRLQAALQLRMPVLFSTDSFQFAQKSGFNPMEFDRIERINGGVLRLIVENTFPFDMGLHVEFLNENEDVLFELFEGQVAEAASLGPDGKSVGPKQSILLAELTREEAEYLKNSSKIRVRALVHQPNGTRAAIYSNYTLDVNLTADFTYEQNL